MNYCLLNSPRISAISDLNKNKALPSYVLNLRVPIAFFDETLHGTIKHLNRNEPVRADKVYKLSFID